MEFGMKRSFSIPLHGLVVLLCHLFFLSLFFVDFTGKLLFWFSMVSAISALDYWLTTFPCALSLSLPPLFGWVKLFIGVLLHRFSKVFLLSYTNICNLQSVAIVATPIRCLVFSLISLSLFMALFVAAVFIFQLVNFFIAFLIGFYGCSFPVY